MSCQERVQIRVQGDAEESYESLVSKAMMRGSVFLEGAAIYRRELDCTGEGEEWYVGCVDTAVSPGGTSLQGAIVLVRKQP